MVRKCRRAVVADIAVMEVAQVGGVRTQAAGAEAMAPAATATTTATLTRKRKLNNEDLGLSPSRIQLRNSKITIEDKSSKTASDSRDWSPNLYHDRDRVSTSCCSSNGSSEEVDERIEFVDLEDESVEVETSTYYSRRERRETTASSLEAAEESDDLDSKAKRCSSEANSRRRSTVEKMPTESEIDEFFAEAEKQLLKQYSEKYNFDFIKEKPMEGRYEWVRLKP